MKTKKLIIALVILFSGLSIGCRKESSTSYWPTDEWKAITPSKAGLDGKILEKLDSVENTLPDISSIIVVRHGYLVLEKYYIGNADTLRSAYSVSKSIISSLIGIAIKQGLIRSIDQNIVEFFPENRILNSDPMAGKVTLRHLLTMSDEIRIAGNVIEYYLVDPSISKKLVKAPGTDFRYNDLSAQLASLILTSVTGKSALDYGRQCLFDPIGIRDLAWRKLVIGSTETSNGANGILLTTRDLAKIGYLYLKKGIWQGRELIPENWIEESTIEQIQTDDASSYFKKYGYYWWVHTFAGKPGYFARGWGGQLICVVPELDFVVVVTSKATRGGGESRYLEMIEKNIIAAVRS